MAEAAVPALSWYSVCVPPPPSSGVALLELLAMLDRTDIAARADPLIRSRGSCLRRRAV